MRGQDKPATGLLEQKQPVALLQIEPGRRVLRQDQANGIADLSDLEGAGAGLKFFLIFIHILAPGPTPLYRRITRPEAAFNKCFTPQPIASSSSIMPEMTDSPPFQNWGSLASSPKGLSNSE